MMMNSINFIGFKEKNKHKYFSDLMTLIKYKKLNFNY